MSFRLVVSMALMAVWGFAVSSAGAAVVTRIPAPVFAVGADGIGRTTDIRNLAVAADTVGSQYGAIGYRIEGESSWSRCKDYSPEFYGTPIFLLGETASLSEGTHNIQAANDYSYNWALHNGYPATYDLAESSCNNTSSPPPGSVLNVPFIVDRSKPVITNLTSRQTAPLTAELCGDVSDQYSGIYDAEFLAKYSTPVPVSYSGEKSVHICQTVKYEEPGKFLFGLNASDWAYNSEIAYGYSTVTNRMPSNGDGAPLRFWLTSKKVSQAKRTMRVTFRSNGKGVVYRCAFAGQAPIKCHSPINFTNLGRRNLIILKATDKFGRTKTIRIRVSISS